MKSKKLKKVIKRIFTVGVVLAYFACVAVLVWQGLTPGKQSSNISNSVGDQINDIFSNISSTTNSHKPVSSIKANGYIIKENEYNITDTNTIKCGDEGRLLVEITPSDATNQSILYSSTNDGVITVAPDGNFLAVSPGECLLKATSIENETISTTVKFLVESIPIESICITNKISELKVSQHFFPEVSLLPSNATYQELVWSTSNSKVATVTSEGEVSAISAGTAVITVKVKNQQELTDSFSIEVTPIEDNTVFAESVEIAFANADDENRNYFMAKTSVQLNATVLPSNVTNAGVSWKSSSTSIATVSKSGLVTFKKGGNVTITATSSDGCAKDTVKFMVYDILPTSITLTSNSLTLTKVSDGYTASIPCKNTAVIKATLVGGSTLTSAKYSSNNTSVAKITSKGEITALKEGTAKIKIYCSNPLEEFAIYLNLTITESEGYVLSNGISVTEYQKYDGTTIPLTDNTIEILHGEAFSASPIITPSNASVQTYKTTIKDKTVLSLNADSGEITGLKPGTTTITFTVTDEIRNDDDGKAPSCTITVIVNKVAVTSIEINSPPKELVVDDSVNLSTTSYPYNATNQEVTWKSSNNEILTIEEDGTLTAVGVGSATITATSKDNSEVKHSITINVIAKTIAVEDIEITTQAVTLNRGKTISIIASVLPENATHKKLIWRSDDKTIATVTTSGVIKGIKAGVTTVTVSSNTYEDVFKKITVTVKEVVSETIILTFSGVTKTDDTLSVKVGDSARIRAKLDSSATIKKVTYQSSNTDVATIGQDGVINALADGTTEITISTTDGEKLTAVKFTLTVKKLTLKDTVSNFYYKIRKLVGHFGAFLALGLCAALAYFMLAPNSFRGKAMSLLICFVAGFAVAGITEICQLPEFTAGRWCSFNDVMLDLEGYSFALIAVYGIALIVYLIKLLTKKIKSKRHPQDKLENDETPESDTDLTPNT